MMILETKKLGLLKRLSREYLSQLYISFIRPTLAYA